MHVQLECNGVVLCRFAQAALRRMYRVLLGILPPPDDVTPSFIEDALPEVVGNRTQMAASRRQLLQVQHVKQAFSPPAVVLPAAACTCLALLLLVVF